MEKKLIPAPIDEKHVSLDFLDNVFERTSDAPTNRKRFMGEWFSVMYPSPHKNVVAFQPDNMDGCHWWELFQLLEDIFMEDYGENIVVSVDYSDATGAVFLKFFMYAK